VLMVDPFIRVKVRAAILSDDHILLVEYGDGWEPHFNLPGGRVEAGESLTDALKREVTEETCAEVNIERLVLVCDFNAHHPEYQPDMPHVLEVVFACKLALHSSPRLPERPDPHQVAVRWIPVHDLPSIPLRPKIGAQLLAIMSQEGNTAMFCENPLFR
jgi:8-oxo-dGTP diphosphatase